MTTTDQVSTEPVSWEQLVRLALDGRTGSSLLSKLGDEFLRRSRLDSAAIYRAEEKTLRRQIQMGEESYPRVLEKPEFEGCGRYELPGGVLLFEPEEAEASDFDHQVLLTVLCALSSAELGSRLKRESFAVNLRGVQLQSLYDVGLAIAGTLDLEKLGDEVLLRAVSLLDARVGAFYLFDGSSYRLDKTFGGEARDRVDRDDTALENPGARETGGAPLLPGTEHVALAPIEADGRRLGLLVVADKESRTGVGPFRGGPRRGCPGSDRRTTTARASEEIAVFIPRREATGELAIGFAQERSGATEADLPMAQERGVCSSTVSRSSSARGRCQASE